MLPYNVPNVCTLVKCEVHATWGHMRGTCEVHARYITNTYELIVQFAKQQLWERLNSAYIDPQPRMVALALCFARTQMLCLMLWLVKK